jgi:hypothetical protein
LGFLPDIKGSVIDPNGNNICEDVTEVSLDAAVSNTLTTSEGEQSVLDYRMCSQAGTEMQQCITCKNQEGIWTGLGCIPYTPEGIASKFLPFLIALAGAIALLVSLFGIFQLVLSAGDREKTAGAREMITSALAGLIFILLSMFLLRFIVKDIIQLPGF